METCNKPTPRALVVQDISCLGRCSMTVAVPALSALGVQVIPMPTAVLSTHTGGFGAPARCDLTEFLQESIAHYRSLNLRVNAVLTGYLAGEAQTNAVREILTWQDQALRVVDPVMGDHGKMYSSMPKNMPERMRALCAQADVMTPNWTETCLLTGRTYDEEPLDERALHETVSQLPAARAVVKGVRMAQGMVNATVENGCVQLIPYEHLPAQYPGTGDLFAAVLTGKLLGGEALYEAACAATRFMSRVIRRTIDMGTPSREGVLLEAVLNELN